MCKLLDLVLLTVIIVYFVTKNTEQYYSFIFKIMCEFVVIIWQDLSAWLSVKLHHDFNLKIYINCLDLKNATEYFRLLTDYFNMHVL